MLKPILSCKYKTKFQRTTQLSEQTDRSFNATANFIVRSSLCLIIIMFVCVGVVGVVVVEISAVCCVLWWSLTI